MFRKLSFFLTFMCCALVMSMAQSVNGTASTDFGMSDVFNATVIAVAIAVTSLFKRYAPEKFVDRFIWLPPVVVGIAGALLLTDPFTVRTVLWNSITYAAGATFTVLVVRRIGRTSTTVPEVPPADGDGKQPGTGG